jgi:DNA topoisomerase-1
MEGDLDKVAVGHENWVTLLRSFYGPFASELEEAEKKLPRLELRDEPTDEICPKCGRPMVIKTGRFGRFISCTGYPECKTAKPIVKETGVPCPKCGGAIVERRSKKGRTFYGCANYPNCDFISWDPVVVQRCPVCGSYVVSKTRRGGAARLECAADRTHHVEAESPDEKEPVEV